MKRSPPFLFIGQGVARARKVMTILVGFAAPVRKRKEIVALAPRALDEARWHSPRLLEISHTSFVERAVKASYGRKGFEGLAADVERALLAMHDEQPIAFAFRPADDEYETDFGAWHVWSSLEAGPARWKDLQKLLSAAEGDAASWFAAVLMQFSADLDALPQRKRKVVESALTPAQRKLLSSVVAANKPLDSEGKLALWLSLRGTGPNRPHQYWERTGMGENLLDLFGELGERGRWAEAAAIGVDVLDASATCMDREHWIKRTVLALVRAQKLDEARGRLPEAMRQELPYEPTFAWIELLRLAQREDDAALIVAHAIEDLPYFLVAARRSELDTKTLPKARRDPKRYAALRKEWCT